MKQRPYWKPKFIAAGAVILIATGLRIAELLAGGEWVTSVLGALAVFSGTSVWENQALASNGIDPRWMPDTEKQG